MQGSGRGAAAADGLRLVAHDLKATDLGSPQHIPQIIDLALDDRGAVGGALRERVGIGDRRGAHVVHLVTGYA